MRFFMCPFCGAVHSITGTDGNVIFLCRTCDRCSIVKGSEARPLTTAELAEIDNETFNGIPGIYKAGRGIPIPMLDGEDANCRLGDTFLHIPDGMRATELVAAMFAAEKNPEMLSLSDAMLMATPEAASQVDVHKLRERLAYSTLGLDAWDYVNEKCAFLVE